MSKPDPPSVVVLFSGGVDSAVLLDFARREGTLHSGLFVDYGQPALEEERRAVYCLANKNPLIIAEAKINLICERYLLDGDDRYVPGRNAALISLAINYTVANGANEIWFGATADDDLYPDCSFDFARKMDEVAHLYDARVRAPLVGFHRRDIVELANMFEIFIEDCWSCHSPDQHAEPCGTCPGCRRER